MKYHGPFESLGYTAEDAYRNKPAADARAEEIRQQEPGVQAVVFEDKDIPRGGLRYVVYVSGGNRRSDNPLHCSECGSPGVYKAGMCDKCYGKKDNPRVQSWRRQGYNAGGDEAIDDIEARRSKDDVRAKRRILSYLPADISHDNLNEWHDGFDEAYNKIYDKLAKHYHLSRDNPSWQGVKDRFRRGYHRARAAAMSPRVQSAISRFPQVASAIAPHVGLRDNPTGAISHRDIYEFNQYLRNASDNQVQGIYDKERVDGRTAYATLAKMEADRRGLTLEKGPRPPLVRPFGGYSDNPSIKHDSDTKQYYHVRIRPPKRGEEFRTIEFKPDVKAVIGIHAKKGPRGGRSDIQKLLFSKDKFDIKEIKSWLKENGFGSMK